MRINEICVTRTIQKDILHCLERIKPDQTELAIYQIKLIETGYIQRHDELSKKYQLDMFQILKKWDTETLLTKT